MEHGYGKDGSLKQPNARKGGGASLGNGKVCWECGREGHPWFVCPKGKGKNRNKGKHLAKGKRGKGKVTVTPRRIR